MTAKHAVLPILALIVAAAVFAVADKHEAVSTTAASTTTVSAAPLQERGGIMFYSDLGPDRIDVSAYPAQQRENYAVYARACSRCHTLARSINAPYTSRGWWEFYMTGMRMRGRVAGRPFSRQESKAVLDFLDYDARVRKVEHASDFDKSTQELRRRFNEYVDQRMSELQKNMPKNVPLAP
ncbi:MAG: hypothetical protein ACHQ2Z_13315 [Elusimicrobiota bacterium]